MSDKTATSPATQPEEIKLLPKPKPEPEWESDEGNLRIELQPKKELEWRRQAADLKEKAYLAKDADIEEFIAECQNLVRDDEIGFLLMHAGEQVNAPFAAMLTASAVLVREALDQQVEFDALVQLNDFRYPSSPTKERSELENDVGELAAWITSVLADRPQRMRKQDVDRSTFDALTARLSELVVVCYCKVRGWEPAYAKVDKKKKERDPAD
jgi:hypothetical protein